MEQQHSNDKINAVFLNNFQEYGVFCLSDRNLTSLSLRGVGADFGLTKYSTVSCIVVRTEALLRHDKQLRKRVGGIKKLIISYKSQAKT